MNIPTPASLACWVVLISAAVTFVVSAAGLIAESYRETLIENLALCIVMVASAVVVLQIHAFRSAQGSGFAFFSAAVAFYAVAKFFKARTTTEPRP